MQTVFLVNAILAGLVAVAALCRVTCGRRRRAVIFSSPPPPPLQLVRAEPTPAYRSVARDEAAELVDRPLVAGVAVDGGQDRAQRGVHRGGKPSRAVSPLVARTSRADEQQVEDPGNHDCEPGRSCMTSVTSSARLSASQS